MSAELAEVRRALDREEISPYFQPVVELKTGRLVGFEVLARWHHPDHGLILPNDFIPLAEEDGLIGLLMQQILRKALLSVRSLPEPLILAVNISPSQLQDLHLADYIRRATAEAEFSPSRLTIEITESALLKNLETSQTVAHELKAMGCRLALDDFGTGYSSLRHLKALPFDELKIDHSFVGSMTNTRESRKIVAAIIGLGHSLGLRTVAEGIETEQQADMLLWLGCDMGQGWLYGRPVPASEIADLVASPPRRILASLSSPGDGWAVSSLEALPTQRLAQLQAIYDGVPVGLCFLDRNLRYVSINRRLAEMNGIAVAAHLGRTVQEVIPDTFPIIEPYLLRALQGEAITEVLVVRPAHQPGAESWTARLSYQPALDEADEVIGISIAVALVSDEKPAKDDLKGNDDQRYIDEINSQVPWVMDAEGNNLQVSSHWVRKTTVNQDQQRNLGWLEALHPEDLESTMKTMKEALRTGRPINIEYRVQDIDGEWRWMRSRGSARLGPTGEIIRWYGIVEEINAADRISVSTAV